MENRKHPYLPLYVQDFLTDEKLNECSAESTGVYIRLMCIMHKSEEYGVILLKQKDKQNSDVVKDFALKLVKQMPYPVNIIENSLRELIEEDVIQLNCTKLLQKRMIRDNEISSKRSKAGAKGGKNTQLASHFAKAKVEANTDIENDIENENVIDVVNDVVNDLNSVLTTKYKTCRKTTELIKARLKEGFTFEDFKVVHRKMAKNWGTDEKMCKFLRPITLYSNKFESYLNMKEISTKLTESGVKAYLVGQEWLRNKEVLENVGS